MKQHVYIISAVAVSLTAFSAGAQILARPIERTRDAPAAERAAPVRTPGADGSLGTNAAVAADNTARNVRDRDTRTLTPLDQGGSRADVDTTAQIRKEILAGTNTSVNARNVKIITQGGRVTLRGPVASAQEKHRIGEIATRIARPENVDNQLEVVVTKSSNQ